MAGCKAVLKASINGTRSVTDLLVLGLGELLKEVKEVAEKTGSVEAAMGFFSEAFEVLVEEYKKVMGELNARVDEIPEPEKKEEA